MAWNRSQFSEKKNFLSTYISINIACISSLDHRVMLHSPVCFLVSTFYVLLKNQKIFSLDNSENIAKL